MSCSRILVVAVALWAAACVVEPIDLNDRQCDEEHPCVEGYTCVDELCELDDEDDDDENAGASD